MTTSELITPHHLTRKAIIYIRQSSPHQVLTNQESLRLQYALRERAVTLGWRPEDIEIIDGDLGLRSCKIISWSSCRLLEDARLNRIVPVREDTMRPHAEAGDVFF